MIIMQWLRWWLSPLRPIGVLIIGGFLLYAGWTGRGWPGVFVVLGALFIGFPAFGHLQWWCLRGIQRDIDGEIHFSKPLEAGDD